MIKIATIVFYGIFFWFVFDFVFYAGLMENYIKAYGIKIFFNQFFVDSQYWALWPVGIVVYGTVFMLRGRKKEKIIFIFLSIIIFSLPWIPSVGHDMGKKLFAKEHRTYLFGKIVVKNVTRLYSDKGVDYVLLPDKKQAIVYPKKNRK